MTLFGWDASHYDWDRGPMLLERAKADGITFFTHKLSEGMGYTDPRAGVAYLRARAAGLEFIGAYHVVHTSNPAGQADRCVALADSLVPWWRGFPGWFWQCDAERWDADFPSPAVVKAFCDRLAERSGRRVVCYASRGQYGDHLAELGHPLWNANYGTNRTGAYRGLYPGDGSGRWAAYSGQVPTFLQYGSQTTIGAQGTCDANAYRGSIEQLRTFITGASSAPHVEEETGMTPEEAAVRLAKFLATGAVNSLFPNPPEAWTQDPGTFTLNELASAAALVNVAGMVNSVAADVVAIKASVARIEAAITAGGGNPDIAAVLAHMDEIRDAELLGYTKLYDKVTSVEGRVERVRSDVGDLRDAEADAAHAEADRLDQPPPEV